MADKKKEKVPTKKSNLSPESKPFEIVTPRDLVPRSPSIHLVNRFTTLGSTLSLRPTFQSALVSPSHYDPFESIKPQRVPKSFPKTSPYFTKLPSHNLFFIEPDFSHLKSPEEIAKGYFPSRWHFPAIHLDKPIEFYRDVLLATKSVQINPISCQRIPGRVAFHSLFIMKFISQKDWGMPPYAMKSLSNKKVQYCYHDYIEAWYKVFLYQNESFSHSWFINFDKNFKGVIPLWFHRWWQVHGPVNEILLEEVQESIRYFSTVRKLSHQEAQLPITIHFFDQYKISWILKWQYILSQNNHSCIARQFFVKWWDKFDFSRVQTVGRTHG
jgi:hypothetical protein